MTPVAVGVRMRPQALTLAMERTGRVHYHRSARPFAGSMLGPSLAHRAHGVMILPYRLEARAGLCMRNHPVGDLLHQGRRQTMAAFELEEGGVEAVGLEGGRGLAGFVRGDDGIFGTAAQ